MYKDNCDCIINDLNLESKRMIDEDIYFDCQMCTTKEGLINFVCICSPKSNINKKDIKIA